MRWRLAVARLAWMEQRREEALHAADTTLAEAKDAASPKYQILALLCRGEVLGAAEGGAAQMQAALTLAQRLDAAPLTMRAALALSRQMRPDEKERLHQFAMARAEKLAAPLPDDLRRSFLRRILATT